MKQHITIEQLNELSNTQKERLREWWIFRKGDVVVKLEENIENGIIIKPFPLLSIGQMVELIQETKYKDSSLDRYKGWWDELFCGEDYCVEKNFEGELCDALWEAVKEIL